jgi:hypothetical protein
VFSGHYAAAYALKAGNPGAPLGWLFFATQFVDVAFFALALTGVEVLAVHPGTPGPLGMELVHLPYTHSLEGTLLYSALVLGAFAIVRAPRGVVFAAAVASHFALDLPVHLHDLPLTFSGTEKVGFALWRYPAASLALELSLLLVAYAAYRPAGPHRRPNDLFCAALVAMDVAYYAGPAPAHPWLLALGAEAAYAAAIYGAFRVERGGDAPAL